MFNPLKLASQAHEMQKKMKQVQEDLKQQTVEVSNNAVTIVMNGEQKVISLKLNSAALGTGKIESIENAISQAFNEAVEKIQKIAVEKMSVVTGGLKIPGLNL